MVNQTRVLEIFQAVMVPKLGLPPGPYEVAPIQGDASNRRYYRVYHTGLPPQSPCPSVVLMELADPEAFKASEERVSAETLPIRELPFINIHRHLASCEVAVPRLYHYEEKEGWLFLEDLGDATLWETLKDADLQTYRGYYTQAIDELLKIQYRGARLSDPDCIATGRAFDVPLLLWEFDHFMEYGVEVYQKGEMPPEDRRVVREAFEGIARHLASESRCLTHRDYHSRNLMIHEGRVRVLDFQDALMGPSQYDLASLLRDSYVRLPEDLIGELLDYYLDRREAQEGLALDRPHFLRLFDYASIQRNLKAAGRFAYIHAVKHNSAYLRFIPPTLDYVRGNLSKYPELHGLQSVLSRYVEDLK